MFTQHSTATKESQFKSGFIYFLGMPEDALFRLVVDGWQHEKNNGYKQYESNEEGSVQNVLRAILNGQDYIKKNSTLSVDYVKEIHKTCRSKLKLHDVPAGEFITKKKHGFSIY